MTFRVVSWLHFHFARQIEDFVDRLRARYSARKAPHGKFEGEEFFGIWSYREDMKYSTAWVRNIRKNTGPTRCL